MSSQHRVDFCFMMFLKLTLCLTNHLSELFLVKLLDMFYLVLILDPELSEIRVRLDSISVRQVLYVSLMLWAELLSQLHHLLQTWNISDKLTCLTQISSYQNVSTQSTSTGETQTPIDLHISNKCSHNTISRLNQFLPLLLKNCLTQTWTKSFADMDADFRNKSTSDLLSSRSCLRSKTRRRNSSVSIISRSRSDSELPSRYSSLCT